MSVLRKAHHEAGPALVVDGRHMGAKVKPVEGGMSRAGGYFIEVDGRDAGRWLWVERGCVRAIKGAKGNG